MRFADVLVAFAGSPKDLHSAFSNLVSNAVRYTPAGGTVQLHTRDALRSLVRIVQWPGGTVRSISEKSPPVFAPNDTIFAVIKTEGSTPKVVSTVPLPSSTYTSSSPCAFR